MMDSKYCTHDDCRREAIQELGTLTRPSEEIRHLENIISMGEVRCRHVPSRGPSGRPGIQAPLPAIRQPVYHFLRSSNVHYEGRVRSGFMIVEVNRIGQRYRERDGGLFEPEYVYSMWDLCWKPTAAAALRYIARLRGAGASEKPYPFGLRHPTIISSAGGPGWFSLDSHGGPLIAVAGEAEAIPPDLRQMFNVRS